MAKLVAQCFVWPGIQKDCHTWAWACDSCQFSTVTPLGDFTLPAVHFLHIHIDLVGPLPTSVGCTYHLTATDRFTCWPEVVAILDITGDTVAHAILTGRISRFSCLQIISTSQGLQFESQLFDSLAKLCGIQLSWTTAHQPTTPQLMDLWNASSRR
jgi:hypothetical protein